MAGALFGLFALATLFNRHKTWTWHRLVEMGVLAPFVCQQLLQGQPAAMAAGYTMHGIKLGHAVPLLGGLVGAAATAALLRMTHAAAERLRRRQEQQQRAAQQQQLAQQTEQLQRRLAPLAEESPLSALLWRAASLLLRKAL